MILRMARVRVLGPRDLLGRTLQVLQDFGLVQISESAPHPGLEGVTLSAADQRRRKQLRRILEDTEFVVDAIGVRQPASSEGGPASVSEFARWARRANRAHRSVARLAAEAARLAEERALIQRYRDLLDVLGPELRRLATSTRMITHAAVIPATERRTMEQLVAELTARTDTNILVRTRPLPSGELAVLVVIPAASAADAERMLTEARFPEVPLPAQFGASSLTEAVPLMLARLDAIPKEQAAIVREREAIVRDCGADLTRARGVVHDALARLEVLDHCAITSRAFAIEGWTPKSETRRLAAVLERELGALISTEEVATEEWVGESAPVVLTNPRLFRPFEAVVRLLPLPRYGSIDPTPFVAVFFPVLFGLMLADVGYGVVLAALGLLLHRRSKSGSAARTVAEIMGPCAAFAIVAGVLFGEFFGDLGHRVFGMRPLLFDRSEAVVAFLLVAFGLGVVHVTLGLVLGIVARWQRDRRGALGSGVAAVMVALIVLALLATFEVLPHAILTPSVVALLVAFPVLVALEGIIAPVEFLTTLGNVLSYARVMALGMASVMLAIVANRLGGAVGSAVVGFLFALLFHLVNFAIGVFSPAIHALRLHYVEFFGKFYSPGGVPYQPLAHWRPASTASSP